MQPLPQEFLEKVARDYDLSSKQTEALIQRLSAAVARDEEDAAALNISVSALSSRMTEVYKKFSIHHKGPGKLRALHDFLLPKYQKTEIQPSQGTVDNNDDVAVLVEEIRRKVKVDIHTRCGTMRVLDMEQPIELSNIYTETQVLEKLPHRRWLSINDLAEEHSQSISGLQVVNCYKKLVIFGKPGAGKSTFLKYLAILCNQGKLQEHCVPVFIELRKVINVDNQPNLLKYIKQQWKCCKIEHIDSLTTLLEHGYICLFIDGLDEVNEVHRDLIIQDIENLVQTFPDCQFVLTCRTGAEAYNFQTFEKIVEIADFGSEEVHKFASNWFESMRNPKILRAFIRQLELNPSIQKLAANPLLLSLLCSAFEEKVTFPASRAGLYKECIDLLLKKWDKQRLIKRDSVDEALSIRFKEGFLSQLASQTFEQGKVLFKESFIEQCLKEYIANLACSEGSEHSRIDAGEVIKVLQSQHGLLYQPAISTYAFSHTTFQEYFVARYISNFSKSLDTLIVHIAEQRYREIFLLTAELLPSADKLLNLMKQKTDQLLRDDPKLQQFLCWVKQKAGSVSISYKTSAVRAFYFVLAFDIRYALAFKLSRDIDHEICRARALNHDQLVYLDMDLDLDLVRTHNYALNICKDITDNYSETHITQHFILPLYRARKCMTLAPQLKLALQKLNDELPAIDNFDGWQQWCQKQAETWINSFQNTMITHRDIGRDWQFTDEQSEKIRKYYYINKLLIDCLRNACNVSTATRQKIEDTLLLPIDD